MRRRTFLLASASMASSAALPAASTIGMASGTAGFFVNGAAVSGTATLFDGSSVRAGKSPVRVQLSAGGVFYLSANSQAEVRPERIELESGYGDYQPGGNARVTALGLTIAPGSEKALGRIAVRGKNMVQVASAKGLFRVYNAAGVLVANVENGLILEFEPQAAAGQPTSAIGCLLKKDDKFVIFDQTTRVMMELRGRGFEQEWGNQVQVNGVAQAASQPGQGTTQILDVTNVTRIAQGGCEDIAAKAGGQLPRATPAQTGARTTPPPKASGGGMSAGAKVGIALGAIGGAAGGLFVATKSGRS